MQFLNSAGELEPTWIRTSCWQARNDKQQDFDNYDAMRLWLITTSGYSTTIEVSQNYRPKTYASYFWSLLSQLSALLTESMRGCASDSLRMQTPKRRIRKTPNDALPQRCLLSREPCLCNGEKTWKSLSKNLQQHSYEMVQTKLAMTCLFAHSAQSLNESCTSQPCPTQLPGWINIFRCNLTLKILTCKLSPVHTDVASVIWP